MNKSENHKGGMLGVSSTRWPAIGVTNIDHNSKTIIGSAWNDEYLSSKRERESRMRGQPDDND